MPRGGARAGRGGTYTAVSRSHSNQCPVAAHPANQPLLDALFERKCEMQQHGAKEQAWTLFKAISSLAA